MSLLTRPRFLDTTAAALPLRDGSRWLQTEWVLSRALCRYRVLDFGDVPRSKRAPALRLQLSQFAPFPDPGYAVAWEGASAQVWCWDASRLRGAFDGAGVSVGRAHVVPESLCYPPVAEGPRLLKVSEGYEGQVWKARALVRSRFWTAAPGADDWVSFQRDAGIQPELQAARPTAVEQDLLPRPYLKIGEGLSGGSPFTLAEPILIFALVALLGSASAWYLTRYWKIAARSSDLTAQMTTLGDRSAPILAAREHAIDDEVFANRLARIAVYPDQLSLMSAFAAAFGSDRVIVRDWNYNVGKLKVVISFPITLPPTANVVAAMQEQPMFGNVRITPANDPKSLAVSSDVKPLFKPDEQARS